MEQCALLCTLRPDGPGAPGRVQPDDAGGGAGICAGERRRRRRRQVRRSVRGRRVRGRRALAARILRSTMAAQSEVGACAPLTLSSPPVTLHLCNLLPLPTRSLANYQIQQWKVQRPAWEVSLPWERRCMQLGGKACCGRLKAREGQRCELLLRAGLRGCRASVHADAHTEPEDRQVRAILQKKPQADTGGETPCPSEEHRITCVHLV